MTLRELTGNSADSGRVWFPDRRAFAADVVADDPADLREGFWAVVVTFEGEFTAVRLREVRAGPSSPAARSGHWPALEGEWRTSLAETAYLAGVGDIRARIAAGTVYQVNLCRVLSHRLSPSADMGALAHRLWSRHPAPYAAWFDLPEAGLEIVSASPEGFLERNQELLVTRPIKGTATTAESMLEKDVAENVMIVDLVRHDLAGVCRPGTVAVDHLCRAEEHPGLVHLVSDVSGRLRGGVTWSEILRATFPPGSVSGAPKHTALQAIHELEKAPRGPYCGAVGWIDMDRQEARLAVGIRTFWADREASGDRWLHFGTGAGITWGSDAQGEWEETRLKARRLISLASARLEP